MTTITKALVGTVAAGAMAISAAAPAMAHDRGGISTGEVIAGALILGGIAAVVASSRNNNNRDYRYDRAGYDGYDNRYGGQYGGQNSYYDNGGGAGVAIPARRLRCVSGPPSVRQAAILTVMPTSPTFVMCAAPAGAMKCAAGSR